MLWSRRPRARSACVSRHWPNPALASAGRGQIRHWPVQGSNSRHWPARKAVNYTVGQCRGSAGLAPFSSPSQASAGRVACATAPPGESLRGGSAWRAHWPRATRARGPCGARVRDASAAPTFLVCSACSSQQSPCRCCHRKRRAGDSVWRSPRCSGRHGNPACSQRRADVPRRHVAPQHLGGVRG